MTDGEDPAPPVSGRRATRAGDLEHLAGEALGVLRQGTMTGVAGSDVEVAVLLVVEATAVVDGALGDTGDDRFRSRRRAQHDPGDPIVDGGRVVHVERPRTGVIRCQCDAEQSAL